MKCYINRAVVVFELFRSEETCGYCKYVFLVNSCNL